MYFRRACVQGWTDSLVVFYKSLRNDPDYRSSIHRYDIPENAIACQAVADVYKCHGDEQEYLHWLEKAARLGYGGAITTWVKYWINQKPLDLKKIESMTDIILERQTDAVKVMAEFYLRNSTLYPGKFEWFIGELKKRKNVFYSQLQEEYGKRGISI